MLRHISLQRVLIGGLLLALLLAAARFLAIQGFLAPIRVTSGSMAPWLLGERFHVACGECGFSFDVGFESQPLRDDAVCPNCGFARNRLKSEQRKRGQRVLIDRGAYWHDSPKRFDAVALNDSERSSRMIVKRIVGLPGERLAIRQGELFIDGNIVRKSLAEFRLLSLPVHNNEYSPAQTGRLPARWRAERDQSAWQTDGHGFHFTPATNRADSAGADSAGADSAGADSKEADSEEADSSALDSEVADGAGGDSASADYDWLVYHHWRCYSSPYPRTAEAPISDNFGYNQGESRALQDVTDVLLRCQVSPSGPGELVIRVHDGSGWLALTLEPLARRASVDYQGIELGSVVFPPDGQYSSFTVEFGVIDEQAVFALDRAELIRQVYVRSKEPRKAIPQPLAIGARTLSVGVHEITIRRDVYYLEPANRGESWKRAARIAAGEYFLLGDNPSLSEDSRHWGKPCVPGSMFHGKVLPLPW